MALKWVESGVRVLKLVRLNWAALFAANEQ
jgi:hypothetical protein